MNVPSKKLERPAIRRRKELAAALAPGPVVAACRPAASRPQPPAATVRRSATEPPVAAVAKPVFRKADWLAFALTTAVMLASYLLTLAPDVTLEDSGELAVAARYAGIPHAPGYPIWTLYGWLFTKLLPFSNIAWRVAVSSTVAGALACGLIALLVSRGSRLLFAAHPTLSAVESPDQRLFGVVGGCVAGMLLGFSGFVWSQAVIVEVYTLSLLSLTALLACLFRWVCLPDERRYLLLAWLLFGICLNNHQSLMVVALAMEVGVVGADPRLGRDLFLGNSLCYGLGLMAKSLGWLPVLSNNPPLLACYHAIGLASLFATAWLALKTKGLGRQFPIALACAGMFFAGAAGYLWMPIASMTNPPMNWAYPRTVAGFIHALTRGQYEPVHPVTSLFRYCEQLGHLALGALEEFHVLFLVIGLVPLLLLRRFARRERGWLLAGLAFYLVLGPGLLLLINPGTDRAQQELVRVFFAASHVPVAMAIGFGLALGLGLAVRLARDLKVPRWLGIAGAAAVACSLATALLVWRSTELAPARVASWLPLALASSLLVLAWRPRFRWVQAALLGAIGLMPISSALHHWWDNEQRGHLFGFWFGHDMFTPPFRAGHELASGRAGRAEALAGPDGRWVYPEMARHAILFGGTDPGRFCPTYMIFCESFLKPDQRRDPEFDRRDVYIITQNALADGHYLEYIRAHYQRSAQRDPYFFSEALRGAQERDENTQTNLLARLALPLDRGLTAWGAGVEARRRREGVYPPQELRLPTDLDLSRAVTSYYRDLQARAQHGQLRPGEEVRMNGNRAEFSGTIAVMGINALLTRQIFEQNPEHEFYVEESYPLDWMYPHLTPFGIIMKLERQPLAELAPEQVERDRRFWRDYAGRLIGDWVCPETNITELCTFAERVHLRRDLTAYAGDRAFLRDDQAQRAFSKLRLSIGGIYDWRFRHATSQWQQASRNLAQAQTPGQRQQSQTEQQHWSAEQTRMFREAEFAFKQAYAFSPFNPEAFQRLVNLLLAGGRVSEALALAQTSQKLDPGNSFYTNIADQLRQMPLADSGRRTDGIQQ